MKILVNDYAGYSLCLELSQAMANEGYQVMHTFAGYNTTPKGNVDNSNIKNLIIRPLYTNKPLQKYSFVNRWKQEREYGHLLIREMTSFSPDIVLSADTPLDAQNLIQKYCNKNRIKFIFWLQDVIGIATERILKKRLSVLGSLIGKYYISMEKRILKNSDRVILITDDFYPLMEKWNIPEEKTITIPNWGPLNNLFPENKNNKWSQHYNFTDTFNFMYTGTIGMKHNPDLLLQLALHFKNEKSVRIIVVSEGPGAEWLTKKKLENGLRNLSLFKYQPYEVLSSVLASSDVLISILDHDASIYSVPSKILSYLCAQRPLLLAIPSENMAARIVKENQAGLVVEPERVENFISLAVELYQNQDLRKNFASNGRKYAEDNFKIEKIVSRFEDVIFW